MVDKSSFMKMLLHVMNVEAGTDHELAHWEEALTASGACTASGVVNVERFVVFNLALGVEGVETVL
eukprot:2851910-Amphidinium_carterae.1